MEKQEYSLNQGQKEAAEAFFEFLFSPDKEFIISGPAGVGKTYLMNYIVDNTMPRYHETCKLVGIPPEFTEVVMTATTNKAAEVLSIATKRAAQTIHSFLNLTVRNDFNTGRSVLTKTNNWTVHQHKIIFVDEASMIDSALYKTIQEGTAKCKIVYVGDHCQLSPVQERISPVYRQNSPFYVLTQQMRNNGQPALMNVCNQLRHTVETGEFHPIQIVPGVIDLVSGEDAYQIIDNLFRNQNDYSKIIAYTNSRVIEYNGHVRALRNLPDSFQPGEHLVNNSPCKIGRKAIPAEMGIIVRSDLGVDQIEVEPNVWLDIQRLAISTPFDIYDNVMVPLNRNHYDKLVKFYSSRKNWERYFYLKENFMDLRPRDAVTVHKAQGSTYENVFIDLTNISTCNMADQTARMLYVAFSRPKTRIYLYGELSLKYGGLIRP